MIRLRMIRPPSGTLALNASSRARTDAMVCTEKHTPQKREVT